MKEYNYSDIVKVDKVGILFSDAKFMKFEDCRYEWAKYNGSVVKTKKISFYNELTCMFRGRKNPPSGYLSYAAYGRSIAG